MLMMHHVEYMLQFADFCECRQVLQTSTQSSSDDGGSGSGDGDGGSDLMGTSDNQCSVDLNIQELCNGTLASPCDCTSLECQV